MRIVKITMGRQLKIGLPQYSSALYSMFVDWEIAEGETPNYDEMWKTIDEQLTSQAKKKLDPKTIAPSFSDKDNGDLPF